MIKQMKQDFSQTTLIAIIWVALLATIQGNSMSIWRIIGIGLLVGIIFGGVYPYLWHFSTLGAVWNIVISTVCNIGFQILALLLYSPELFKWIAPYLIITSVMTFGLHLIIFYFYMRHLNRQLIKELNQIN